MSQVPGYNPIGYNSNVSYPSSPYTDARNAAFQSAGVPAANVTYRPEQNTGRGRGRGGGRGRGNRASTLPKTLKVFTCANKHPIGALKELRPDAAFDIVCSYMTNKGAAIVVTTTIDTVVYQGEGTTSQIARTIAAHKALVGMNANESAMVQQSIDYEEQKKLVLERINIWQEIQAKKESKRVESVKAKEEAAKRHEERKAMQAAQKEERAALKLAEREERAAAKVEQQITKKKRTNSGATSPVKGPASMDYGYLLFKYGPDITETTAQLEEKSEQGFPMFKCTLSVQGSLFEAVCSNKKGARNMAVNQAFTQFAEAPPPIVNEKKRKIPEKREKKIREPYVFKTMEPVEFQDKLAEKCWNFVTDKLSEVKEPMKCLRNLVVLVKVESDDLEKCDPVAFGSGTLLASKDKITADGLVIKDSTGESLAQRAFRRYLLDQVELCLGNKPSVYAKDRTGGKCSIKSTVKFYLYTNSSPMGDCRSFNWPKEETKPVEAMETNIAPTDTPVETPAEIVPTDTEMKVEMKDEMKVEGEEKVESAETPGTPKRKPRTHWRRRFQPRICDPEDFGKLSWCNTSTEMGSEELPQVKFEEDVSHYIPSPSDKLGVRQMCGVQGSVLYGVSSPVHISHYFIGRSFYEESITRALYGRFKEAKVPRGCELGPEPLVTRVAWKAAKLVGKKTKWALIWAEGHELEIIYTPEGKQLNKTADTENLGEVVEHLAPSDYCTKHLFTAFINVCKKSKKTFPQKYSVCKAAGTKYRQLKTSVVVHLKDSGLGEWATNPINPDY